MFVDFLSDSGVLNLKKFDNFEKLDSIYRKILTQVTYQLESIGPAELKAICTSFRARSSAEGDIPDPPNTKEGLIEFLEQWTTPIDVNLVRYLENAIATKKRKKVILKSLAAHKKELQKLSKLLLPHFCKKEVVLKRGKGLAHMIVEIGLTPEEYILRELFRLQEYFNSYYGFNPLLFKGFTKGSTLLFFQITSTFAAQLAKTIHCHLFSLREFHVVKILVKGHFAFDLEAGLLYPLVSHVTNTMNILIGR